MISNPVTASPETPLIKLAQLMKGNLIGSVILVRENKPYGIVTERDLVWRVIANGKDSSSMKASEICSKPVLTISEEEGIEDALEFMKECKVRRLVVINKKGEVLGILTSDDIVYNIEALSKELALQYIILSKNIHGRTRV